MVFFLFKKFGMLSAEV